MKTDTLGALLKAAERKAGVTRPTPEISRSFVYLYMGKYVSSASMLASDIPMDPEESHRALGALVHAVAIDAKVSLPPEKFKLLEGYPLTEEHQDLELNKGKLAEALAHTWAEEDIFIRRLSGGLFGSYMQALSTLKPHVRALGIDLSAASTAHVNNL